MLAGMDPLTPPKQKPADYPLTEKPHEQHDAAKVDPKVPAKAADKQAPADAAHGKQYTTHGVLDQSDPKATVVDDGYAREVRQRERVADDVVLNLVHQVDGRTTDIARELKGDAAVLEQLAAQLRLDSRDNRVLIPSQAETLTVTVARMRALAEQLVQLCASRDRPLPQIATLPAPAHVPPARA